MKPIQGLFKAEVWMMLKIIPMVVDPWILQPHQLIDSLRNELPELPVVLNAPS
jgi:hypothetical protein